MRKKLKIPYTKERVVLSDVLPYEVPLIFSNRYFYKLLNKRNKAQKNPKFKKMTWFNDLRWHRIFRLRNSNHIIC